jgi:dTDP-4-dehydrorhamnose 3,5-epimerase-like enzyme
MIVNKLHDYFWIDFKINRDPRGILVAIEGEETIPFSIKRIFYMTSVIEDRGGHAHIDTDQVIVAIHGSFKVALSDGKKKQVFEFNNPEKGLFVPKLIFTDLYDFSSDAVCLVLSNTHYDINKSLRTWEEYLNYKAIENDK